MDMGSQGPLPFPYIEPHDIRGSFLLQLTDEVVLEGVPSENDPPFCPHVFQSAGDGSVTVLDAVTFVADDQIWTRAD